MSHPHANTPKLNSAPIPPEIVAKWQSIVELLAEILGVPAGLVVRFWKHDGEIIAANANTENPFKQGHKEQRSPRIYCETVIGTRHPLHVQNALDDPQWKNGLDVELGLISYLGYPLLWPDGSVFGTLCALDKKPNAFSDTYFRLLGQFRVSIEGDLAALAHIEEAGQTQDALVAANAQLQEQVAQYEELAGTLRKSEERLRGYFESPLLGAAITSPEKRFIEVNDTLCRMLGYTRAEFMEIPWEQVTHPDDVGMCIEYFQRLVIGEIDAKSLDVRLLHKDGRAIYTRMTVRAMRDPDGNFECLGTRVEDVTARRDAEEQLAAYRQHLESLVTDRTAELTESNARLRSEIRQRAEAEAALRESIQRFEAVFRESPMGIAIVDLDGSCRALNPAAETLLGYSSEEYRALPPSVIHHPADAKHNLKAEQELLDGKRDSLHGERRYIRKDGAEIWCNEAQSLVRDENGQPLFVIAMATDITQRKAAEEALRQSEELFRAAQELSPDGFMVLRALRDADHNIHDFVIDYANPSAERLMDRQLIGRRFTEAFPSVKTHSILFAEYIRVIKTGAPHEEELRYEADGVFGWYRNMAIRMNDGVAVSFCDITARKRAEQERVRLATAVEQAAEAILITDAQGLIQYVNPAFERISGYTRYEIIGQNPRVLRSSKQDDTFYRHMWETVLSGQVWRGQLVNLRKDGTSYVEQLSITPLRAEGNEITHFVAIMEDVSERQQLEAQFRQAQKLEAVGRLAGGVAHDFNNLLTAILGSTDLLLGQLHANDPLQEEVREIKRAGERAASLTRQLLAFSRRQVLQPRVLDLNETVRGMEKMLRRLIGEDIRLESRLAPNLRPLRADPGQIEQVMLNLVVNARDAMPSGGRLILETRAVRIENPNQLNAPGALLAGDYLDLSVSDTGSGIHEDVAPHIFEPFFTTKEEGKGTGLGLCTVYGIVRQSGGLVTFENGPGGGAIFRVLLPVADCTDEAPPAASSTAQPQAGGETILVAEDEDIVRSLVCRVLRRQGYTVLETSSGAEALAVIKGHTGPLDLLVSDVIMPGMYGPELAAHALRHRPDLRVIFMTGHADRFLAEIGSAEGAAPILPKPFTPDQLATLVRRILQETSPA
ncbi:MAG: PAS domain S-box protein, partial [FCB group bacterium]|nr:PAS domain S-box protein [FCB group bacterium]